jgi:signal peptidase
MTTRPNPILSLLRRLVDLAIVAVVVTVLVGLVLGRVVPLTGRQTLIIGGGSMAPTIPLGSVVVIEPIDPASLAVGEIVTVRVGPRASVFTHRITRLLAVDGAPSLETKGDANAEPDGATTPTSAVVGRVTFWIPVAGYLLALLSVPIGVVFILGLGLCLVLAAILLEPAEPDPLRGSPAMPRPGRVPPAMLAADALDGRVARHVAARSAGSRPILRRAV